MLCYKNNHVSIIPVLLVVIVFYLYVYYHSSTAIESTPSDLIRKYLVRDGYLTKPILWIYANNEYNSRDWETFNMRSSMKLNRPYLSSCMETILKHCGDSFIIRVINNHSFKKLLPNWKVINMDKLPNLLQSIIKDMAMAKVLQQYGGLSIPMSTIVVKDLINVYNMGISKTGCFVGTRMNHTNRIDKTIMGCIKGSSVMDDYILYLEKLNSVDTGGSRIFTSDIEEYLKTGIHNKTISKIDGKVLGTKDINNKNVNLNNLMSREYINYDNKLLHCINIPERELLQKTIYGWFIRQSQEQLKHCDIMLCKWLLTGQSS
jgi:hypothetical protein